MPVRYCEYKHLFFKNAVHNAERKLMENVAAKAGKIDRPTFGRFLDSRYPSLKFAFKIQRRS